MRFERRYVISDPTVPVADRRLVGYCSLHTHDYFEIELLLAGDCIHNVNGKEYHISRGDVYLLLPSDVHELKIDGEIEIVNISFTEQAVSPSLLYAFIALGEPAMCHFDEDSLSRFEPLFNMIVDSSFKNAEFDRRYRKNLCECVLMSMLERLDVKPGIKSGKSALFRGLLYINRNFEHKITLSELANEAGLSKNYFSTEFNRTFGMSVSDYVCAVRLEYAHSLLVSSDLPITQIALESGFSSFSMFSRAFRKKYGETPTECRQNAILNHA